MSRRSISTVAFALAATIPASSCSHGPSEVLRVAPTISIVSGAGVADTIGARLAEPLTVRMTDSTGKPAALSIVRFTVVAIPGAPNPLTDPPALIGPTSYAGVPILQTGWTDWTDEEGRVAVMVRFGKTAGTIRIAIDNVDLDAHDTATYTVRPGAAVRLDVQPADTALYVGYRYAFRARSLDRADNVRPDAVTLSGGDSVLALDGTAGVIGRRYGRDFTDVATATHSVRVWTSVVPQGTIVTRFTRYAIDEGVGLVRLDGSGRRRIFGPARYPDQAHAARWSRDGKSIVAVERGVTYVIDPESGASRATPAAGAVVPAFSADKRWIYYSLVQDLNHYTLWRVLVDGTTAEQLPVGMQYVSQQPDLSPDGRSLAYVGPDGYEHEMLLADSSDRHIGDAHGLANGPRYSPDGSMIAFTVSSEYNSYNASNGVYVIGVNGTSPRRISPAVSEGAPSSWTNGPSVSWSPDGQWILSGTFSGLRVINVQSGLTIPLPWANGDYAEPEWRPMAGP